MRLTSRIRIIAGAFALAVALAIASASVPQPASAQQQVNPTADSVKEQQLLNQLNVIKGRGTIPDLILQADEVVRVRTQLEKILSAHTGHDVEELRHDTDRDRVFDAAGAVAYGLADRVLEPAQLRRP